MLSSNYNTIKNYLYNERYELGLMVSENVVVNTFFPFPGIDAEGESFQKIKLAKYIEQNPNIATSGARELTTKTQCVWEEISKDPKKFVVSERWKLVLRTKVKVIPLVIYTALFAKEIGFSQRKLMFCAIIPVFSRITIALVDQANISNQLLEILERIDKVIHFIFQILTEICLILRKIPWAQEGKDQNVFKRYNFSVYFIDLGLTKVIDFLGNNKLFLGAPFTHGYVKSTYFWRIQRCTDYFNSGWLFLVEKAYHIGTAVSEVIHRRQFENIHEVWTEEKIKARQQYHLNPQHDNYVELANAYQKLETQGSISLLQYSWKYLTQESELAFAKKVHSMGLVE